MTFELRKPRDPDQQRLYASLTALRESLDTVTDSNENLDDSKDSISDLGVTRSRSLRLPNKLPNKRAYGSLSALARNRHPSATSDRGSLHDVVASLTAQMRSTSQELRATTPDLRARASDLRERTRSLEASPGQKEEDGLSDLKARAHALEDAMHAAEEAAKVVERARQGIREKVETMMAVEKCLESANELVDGVTVGTPGNILASFLCLTSIIFPILTECWHTHKPATIAFSLPLACFFTLNTHKWVTDKSPARREANAKDSTTGWREQLVADLEMNMTRLRWSRDMAGCHACVFGLIAVLALNSESTNVPSIPIVSCSLSSALSCVSAKKAYKAYRALREERLLVRELQKQKGASATKENIEIDRANRKVP